jgi:hypothetical protein
MFSLELKAILVTSSYQNWIMYRHMKQELMINFFDTKVIWLDITNLLCNMQRSCYFSYQQCLNTCRLPCILRKKTSHCTVYAKLWFLSSQINKLAYSLIFVWANGKLNFALYLNTTSSNQNYIHFMIHVRIEIITENDYTILILIETSRKNHNIHFYWTYTFWTNCYLKYHLEYCINVLNGIINWVCSLFTNQLKYCSFPRKDV